MVLLVVPAKAGTHNHDCQGSGRQDAKSWTPSHGRQVMDTKAAYYVYILASRRYGTLYIGICRDLSSRLSLHRSGRGSKFVAKYGVTKLVYVETYDSPAEAIAREKALKEWRRDWKIRLIEQENPDWRDLSHLI